MEKMTIHRGLAELKLLDSRIEKTIQSIKATGINQEGSLVDDIYREDEFNKDAKAKFQSVNDLIERKVKIKAAIVKANGTAKVEINGKKMTIADAINHKGTIALKKSLITELNRQNKFSQKQASLNNTRIDENALKLAQAALQKDNVKINEGDAVAITGPYIKKNKYHLVDPLNVESLIEKLQNEVDEFETEIDAALSEINAITLIEI